MEPLQHALLHALVLRCQIGDRRALEELFLRFDPALGCYLGGLLGRDAMDTRQEVWLIVLGRLGRLKSPEAFAVWFFRIARRKALDRMGAKVHGPAVENAAIPADASEWAPEDAALLRRGLEELPSEQREALVLRFAGELSYEQIAEVTGAGVGTVRSRLHYAKEALRRRMEEQTCQHANCGRRS